MDGATHDQPRARRAMLPSRGGAMALLDFGPQDRPVDLVFSHANGFNGLTYRSILAPLAAEFRLIAIDMRGHGASTLPAVPDGWAGWTGYRDDLLALLGEVADGPVLLAGHSMGATTSLLAAEAAPDRVKGLALFDPVLFDGARAAADPASPNPLAEGAERRRADFPSKAAAREAYTGRGAFKTWSPGQLADYVEAGFVEAPDGQVTLACRPAWEASNFRVHHYNPWSAFRNTRCPTRMLRAETASTARIEDHLSDLDTPRIRYETVPGTTHFLPMERPELVRDVLRGMLA